MKTPHIEIYSENFLLIKFNYKYIAIHQRAILFFQFSKIKYAENLRNPNKTCDFNFLKLFQY